jgi:hypothetical protein
MGLAASSFRTTRSSARRATVALVLLSQIAALCGCGASASTPPRALIAGEGANGGRSGIQDEASPSAAASRFFSPASFWYRPAANEPVDARSAAIIAAFDSLIAEEQQARTGPWINTTEYSVPVYTVPARQPRVRVALARRKPEPVLQRAWAAVPLPPNAQPALGHDGLLVVWQPSSDRLWEFWQLRRSARGWQATWGGAMRHASSNHGAYGPAAWPGAKTSWGASASSLSLLGGLITLEDLQRGAIDHALSMSIPNVRAGVYSMPARRTDGRDPSPLALPEGAHLRLNPSLDLASLHLPPLTLLIAEAAQRYGIFVRDGSAVVTFQAQDPIPTGSEPYAGPNGYFEGQKPRELLAQFPWDQLELLKLELRRNRQMRFHRVGLRSR